MSERQKKLLNKDRSSCVKHINTMMEFSNSSLSTLHDRMYSREVIRCQRIRIKEIDELLKNKIIC